MWRSENATPESKKPQKETWAELSLENKLLGGGATSSTSENNTHDDKDRVEWRQHQHGPKRCREAAFFFFNSTTSILVPTQMTLHQVHTLHSIKILSRDDQQLKSSLTFFLQHPKTKQKINILYARDVYYRPNWWFM